MAADVVFPLIRTLDGRRTIYKFFSGRDDFKVGEIYIVDYLSVENDEWITHERNSLILVAIVGDFTITIRSNIEGQLEKFILCAGDPRVVDIPPLTTFNISTDTVGSKLLCVMNGVHDNSEYTKRVY